MGGTIVLSMYLSPLPSGIVGGNVGKRRHLTLFREGARSPQKYKKGGKKTGCELSGGKGWGVESSQIVVTTLSVLSFKTLWGIGFNSPNGDVCNYMARILFFKPPKLTILTSILIFFKPHPLTTPFTSELFIFALYLAKP